MGFFDKLLPIAAGLGLGLVAPMALPALGLGGAGAGAGAAGAGAAGAGAATGAASATAAGSAAATGAATGATVPAAVASAAPAIAPAAVAPAAMTPAAAGVGASTPVAELASKPFLTRAAGWLGNHPMEALGGVGMAAQMFQKPQTQLPGLAPAQVSAPAAVGSPAGAGPRGPQDLGFQQNLISNLRRPY